MKSKILWGIIVILTVISITLFKNSTGQEINLIYKEDQLTELLETVHPANVFIDLRERKDYEEGHIDGFINLPTCDGSEVLGYLNKKDLKKKSIYVICYKDRRSAATIELLHKNGYKHLSYITFGYDDYVESQHDFKPKTGECDCLAD